MNLLDSLLDAIVRLEGDALVMHVGEKPYVVTTSTSMNAYRGPLAWGQVELSSRMLTSEAVLGMLGQILPLDQRQALEEYGAIEYEVPGPNEATDRFTIVAARGGDDVWLEVRRRPRVEPEIDLIDAAPSAAGAAAAESVEATGAGAPAEVEVPIESHVPLETDVPAEPVRTEAEVPEEADIPDEVEVSFDAVADVETEMAPQDPAIPAESEEPVLLIETSSESEQVGDEEEEVFEISLDEVAAGTLASEGHTPAIEIVHEEIQGVPTNADVDAMLAETAAVLAGDPGGVVQDDEAELAPEALTFHPATSGDSELEEPVEIFSEEPLEPAAEAGAPCPPADPADDAVIETPEHAVEPAAIELVGEEAAVEPALEEPVLEEPAIETVTEAAAEEVPVEPTVAASAEPHPEPVVEPRPELVAESHPKAVAEWHPEPVAEPEPVARLARQPVPETPVPIAADEPRQAVILPLARPSIRPEPPIEPRASADAAAPLDRVLRIAAARGAATVYVVAQSPPMIRVDGEISVLDGEPALTAADVERLVMDLSPARGREGGQPAGEWVADLPDVGRVRCVTFRDHRGPGLIFRMIPPRAISADQLGLSVEVQALCAQPDGLVLVAGARASGKSTLLTAFVDLINRTRSDHVITIEPQIGFVHETRRSFISQREVRGDGEAAVAAVRSAFREDPDVLVIEDLRTPEIVSLALEAAESGRLVLASVAAATTVTAVERLIEIFPAERRAQAQTALAGALRGVVSQVLLRKVKGGRVAAREVLLNTPAVASLILEGKTFQLPVALDSGRRHGMMPFADALASLVREGTVHGSEAFRKAPDREALLGILKRDGVDTSFAERLA